MTAPTTITTQMKCISSPLRLRLLGLLHDGASVGDLCDALGMPQATVSRHLRLLCDAGLLVVQPRHRANYYTICEDRLREVFAAAQQLAGLPP